MRPLYYISLAKFQLTLYKPWVGSTLMKIEREGTDQEIFTQKPTITIIDGSDDIGQTLCLLFESEGYDARFISSRDVDPANLQVLQTLFATSPDLHIVLYDIVGYELEKNWQTFQEVATALSTPTCAVIPMSTAGEAIAEKIGLSKNQVISKPFEIDEILSCVKNQQLPREPSSIAAFPSLRRSIE